MSELAKNSWDLDLRKRKEVITIKGVCANDFTWTEVTSKKVIDQNGKQHILSIFGFLSSEWKQIQKGAKIEITIKECVTDSKVLS